MTENLFWNSNFICSWCLCSCVRNHMSLCKLEHINLCFWVKLFWIQSGSYKRYFKKRRNNYVSETGPFFSSPQLKSRVLIYLMTGVLLIKKSAELTVLIGNFCLMGREREIQIGLIDWFWLLTFILHFR